MISVIVPVFNEEQSIGKVVQGIHSALKKSRQSFEIVVVDDCSTDSTHESISQLPKSLKVWEIRHGTNRGYGASLKTGIRNAKSETIVIIDADETYPAGKIPELVKALEGYDMVVGSREGMSKSVPFSRRPAKWMLTKLCSYLSETRIPDINSGLRVFRKSDAERFFPILSNRFSFTTTITLAYLTNNLSVKYVPIEYFKREGKSTVSPRDFFGFLSLIIKTISYFNPMKVFLPVSVVLFLGAVAFFLATIFTRFTFDTTIAILILAAVQGLLFGLLAEIMTSYGKVKR